MEFKREIIINKPIAAVWDILANQYGDAHKWVSGLNHSNEYGSPIIEGAHCSNRACETSQGKIKEVITKFDAKSHELEYEVIEGFPFFVEVGKNNWKLHRVGQKTQVNMNLTIQTKGFVGMIMTPMMKLQMNKITTNAINDLKHYAETGKPSPLKAKELKKLQKKAA